MSPDHANSARRLTINAELALERITNVRGHSDTEPLLPENTTDPSNRRIGIVLLHENKAPAPTIEGTIGAPIFNDKPVKQRSLTLGTGDLPKDDASDTSTPQANARTRTPPVVNPITRVCRFRWLSIQS